MGCYGLARISSRLNLAEHGKGSIAEETSRALGRVNHSRNVVATPLRRGLVEAGVAYVAFSGRAQHAPLNFGLESL